MLKIPKDWLVVMAVALLGVGCLVAGHAVKGKSASVKQKTVKTTVLGK